MDGERFTEATLIAAHKACVFHRTEIEASKLVGCFHCFSTFRPGQILEWYDQEKPPSKWSAICPICEMDTVIGDRAGYPLTTEFLAAMKSRWCSNEEE